MRRMRSRLSTPSATRVVVGAVVCLLCLAWAGPASAQEAEEADTHVVLTGRVEVRAGERADNVVIFDGPATIEGAVEGVVVALNGDVRVTGSVQEDVVALNGRAVIENGARVGGDVVSSKSPVVDAGATVGGETRTVRFSFRAFGIFMWVAWWIAVTVSLVALGLLVLAVAPAMIGAANTVARDEPGRAVGWGLLVAVGLPVLSIAVLFTLVGIPLGLLGLLSLALLFAVGYITAGFALGRTMVKEPTSPYLAFLAGVAVLRVVGLIPVVGGLVTFVAAAYGIGALTIAGLRAARGTASAVASPFADKVGALR